MIDVTNYIPEKISMSKRFILEELNTRGGWQAFLYYDSGPFMRLIRPDGHSIELMGVAPQTTTAQAAFLADDKYATFILLKENNIPTPNTILCSDDFDDQIHDFVKDFPDSNCVVKPLDSGHGNGITLDIDSREKLSSAIVEALRFSDKVIVQQQIENGLDIRFTIVDYSFTGAVVRIPAAVIGDGVHSISELIDLENKSSLRGENYTKPLHSIDNEAAKKYLNSSIDTIPALNEEVKVIGVANVGKGGKLLDVTDLVSPELKELAEKTAKVCSLPVCGVDIMVKVMPSHDTSMQELDPQVIEVNKSPSLFIADVPRESGERVTIKAFVDYLERL